MDTDINTIDIVQSRLPEAVDALELAVGLHSGVHRVLLPRLIPRRACKAVKSAEVMAGQKRL